MDIQEGLQRLGYQFVPFLFAVVIHEFGHGFAASLWGDKTAQESGRLTLNPVPHIDPIGTLLFPIIGMFSGINFLFGWARPVPIDPRRFRDYRKGLFSVALAGPAANLLGAFLCALGLCLMARFVARDFQFHKEFSIMLEVGIFINVGLGIFNLIPLPPLDGSRIVESFLSYSAQQKYDRIAQYSTMILLALMFTGVISVLHGPIMWISNTVLAVAGFLTGVQTI